MAGIASRGNSMSITAPMHWTMVPAVWASAMVFSWLHRRRSADDLRYFLGDPGLPVLVVDEGELVDQGLGVVGCGFPRHRARAVLGGHVLGDRLEDDRLDVAREHLLEHGLRLGLVEVVPVARGGAEPLARQGQELLHDGLLLHGVDKARIEKHQPVEAVLGVAVEHHLHRADQPVHLRPVADLHDVRHYTGSKALHKAEALAADRAHLHFLALRFPFLVFPEREAKEIRVERPAQALVGADHDHPDALHGVALDEEGMAVFRVRMADVRGDVADLLAVGTRLAHALLRLPHLGGGDHLHRLGDLPGVLHTPDLHPDFFRSRHQKVPLFFQSSIAAFSAFSSSAERSFLSSMPLTMPGYLPFMVSRIDFSAASAFFTSMSSK